MQRIDVSKVSHTAYKAVAALEAYVEQCALDNKLLHLIKIRASQINGCAYCIAMHTRDARKLGESDERMHLLDAWREAPVFSDRERAALVWTEALTLVAKDHVPDAVFDEVRKQFSEKEIVDLTAAVCAINTWNRSPSPSARRRRSKAEKWPLEPSRTSLPRAGLPMPCAPVSNFTGARECHSVRNLKLLRSRPLCRRQTPSIRSYRTSLPARAITARLN